MKILCIHSQTCGENPSCPDWKVCSFFEQALEVGQRRPNLYQASKHFHKVFDDLWMEGKEIE